ncbi:MAG: hypothetical protein M3522_01530 [Actinomycetota bacterium]|jgi:hypothetical protein|nr:hypothetical protein [Actinomycetota bacterium]
MEIQLRRAFDGDEVFPWNCAICECGYTPRTVMADIVGDEGDVCPDCLGYLHGRHPELFPSVELLDALAAKYPTPVYPNSAAVRAAEAVDLDEASRQFEDSYLWRPGDPQALSVGA